MNTEKKLTAIIEKTHTGFSGYLKELPGIAVAATTLLGLKENFREALSLHIETLEEDGENVDHLKKGKLEFVFDMDQLFEHYSMIKKSAFAEYIGINKSLFRSYTKGLAKASDKRVQQINKGLHKLGEELTSISLK